MKLIWVTIAAVIIGLFIWKNAATKVSAEPIQSGTWSTPYLVQFEPCVWPNRCSVSNL